MGLKSVEDRHFQIGSDDSGPDKIHVLAISLASQPELFVGGWSDDPCGS